MSSLKALALVVGSALATGAFEYVLGSTLTYTQVSVVFLVPIIVAVACWGMVSGLVAVIAAKCWVAYCFYPPSFSLEAMLAEDISDARLYLNMLTFVILLGGILRHQARGAARREAEMHQLYSFSRKLVRANSTTEIFSAIQSHLETILGRKVLLVRLDGEKLVCIPPEAKIPPFVHAAAVETLSTDGASSARINDDGSVAEWLVRPVSARTAAFGAVVVELGVTADVSFGKIDAQVATTLADASEALEQLEIEQAIQDAKVRAGATQLREAIIGAISHDLGTPLSTILCSATVLSTVPIITADARLLGLVNAIREQAQQHIADIENLLDASRINAKAVPIRLEWTDVSDIVNSAVERLRHRRGDHRVKTQLPGDLPVVHVDALLVERALLQVLDNAAKYSLPGTSIELAVARADGCILLTVSDSGAGLTKRDKETIWQQFYRGERHANSTDGFGLGLWVAQAFVAANGGTITADSAGAGRGTTVSITLPLASRPRRHTKELATEA